MKNELKISNGKSTILKRDIANRGSQFQKCRCIPRTETAVPPRLEANGRGRAPQPPPPPLTGTGLTGF